MKKILFLLMGLALVGCFEQQRDCLSYKTGKFQFEQVIDSITEVSIFERTEKFQIETFRGKTDTSTVRWINDCEFILQKINPKNMAEQKSIHMKIINTTDKGYEVEYSFVNDANKMRGFVTKIK
jgi:hypothetical protein